MTVVLPERRLLEPTYTTALPSVPFPFPHDVDLAPHLLVVTLAQTALAAAHRALDSAHPVLALAATGHDPPVLTDSEHLAVLVIEAGNHLANLLAAYAATVVQDHLALDEDPF